MERIVRTLAVNGYEVAVVEDLEEDGSSFVLSVDNSVINADSPLASIPSDYEICAAVLSWSQCR